MRASRLVRFGMNTRPPAIRPRRTTTREILKRAWFGANTHADARKGRELKPGRIDPTSSSEDMSGRPGVLTGARNPEEVTHGFTLNNPAWAWLILQGHKIIENRQTRLQPGWYAVHVAVTAHCSIMEELPLSKEFKMPSVLGMENGVVYGLCKIGMSVPFEQCKDNRWACTDYKVCNVITEVIPFVKTVKASGNLGAWPLKESTEIVRQGARDNLHNKKPTKALESLGLAVDGSDKSMKRPADDPHDRGRPSKMKASTEPSAALKRVIPPQPVEPNPIKSVANFVPKGDIRNFFT